MFNLFGPPDVNKMKAIKDVEGLIKALSYQKADSSRVILGAIRALGELGDARAVQPLTEFLRSKDETIRGESIAALQKIGDVSVINPLIGRLNDDSRTLQNAAVDALAGIGNPVIPYLLKAMPDNWLNTRERKIEVLVRLAPAVVDPLVAMLQEKDPFARQSAADALGTLKDKRAVEPLIHLIKDQHADVRRYAASALGKLGDEVALPALLEALKDPNSGVRVAASDSLGILKKAEAADGLVQALVKSDRDTRERFSAALIKIGMPATPPVLAAFQDANVDWHARYYLALTLGSLKDPSVVSALTAVLQEGCQEELRFGIVSALTFLGGAEAEEAIQKYGH